MWCIDWKARNTSVGLRPPLLVLKGEMSVFNLPLVFLATTFPNCHNESRSLVSSAAGGGCFWSAARRGDGPVDAVIHEKGG